MGKLHPENSEMMMNWIGAVYYWVEKGKDQLDVEISRAGNEGEQATPDFERYR